LDAEHALPDAALARVAAALAQDQAVPGCVGHYRLVEVVGEGGMGTVWRAEQEHPIRRTVAVKLIKPGMDSRQVIARFEAERQALAMMNHPNVARVLDAGTTDAGQPYFVMEYVPGEPITAYCDRQACTIRQRLELFAQACAAVGHAHQKAIIHRDLKPGNVLVTLEDGRPVVKVIDFGIAKATSGRLTDRTLLTEHRQLIGTPQYMSPEQAQTDGADVDTRSDIYSLGVLLYELLTGTTPFGGDDLRDKSCAQIQRIIREVEPPRPSTRFEILGRIASNVSARNGSGSQRWGRLIRRELDWIVMKCLEKDRARRYETASALAEDVRRHLRDEPVVARPPSALYALGKLVRRHKARFAAATAVLLALVLGVVGTSIGFFRAAAAHKATLNEKHVAVEKLWGSYRDQARAGRRSGLPGRRFDSLRALTEAAKIRPALELRNEAIAAMALADVRPLRRLTAALPGAGARPGAVSPEDHLQDYRMIAFDARLRRYARGNIGGDISVRSLDDAHRELLTLPSPGSATPVQWLLRFSPDGRYLLAVYGADSARLIVWDLERATAALTLDGVVHVAAADFSPDGASLAIGCRNGSVVIYDLASARPTLTLASPAASNIRFRKLRYDPAGQRLAATTDDGRLCVVPLRQGAAPVKFLAYPQFAEVFAWHRDGRRLAAGYLDYSVQVWDVESGRRVATAEGHFGEVMMLEFNAAGDLLASGAWDGTLRLWNPDTGRKLLSMPGVGTALRFNEDDRPHGDLIAFGDGREIQVAEVVAGREYHALHGHETGKGPFAVAFSIDDRVLASRSVDGVRFWHGTTGRPLGFLQPKGGHRVLYFPPDGASLLTESDSELQSWPVRFDQTGVVVTAGAPRPIEPHIPPYGCCFSADGRTIVAREGNRILAARLDHPRQQSVWLGEHAGATYLAVSTDGKWAASSTRQHSGVKVWDVGAAKLALDLPGQQGPAHVAFSPDGRWLVVGEARRYTFWEIGSWRRHHHIDRDPTANLEGPIAFTPDSGVMAMAYSPFVVRLVTPDTGMELASLEGPEPHSPGSMCFSRDGRRLAIAAGDRVVELWDLQRVREQLAEINLDWATPAPRAVTAPHP
jgi:serine/threonine protein kinase/WD40 repeat protein